MHKLFYVLSLSLVFCGCSTDENMKNLDSLTEEAPDWDPVGLTLEELEAYYGNIDVRLSSTSYCSVKMNWGWGGRLDNVLINYRLSTLVFGDSYQSFDVDKPNIRYPSRIEL